jgi:hypothetical protein
MEQPQTREHFQHHSRILLIAYERLDPFTSPLLLKALTVRVEIVRDNQIKTGRLMVVCASNHNDKRDMESDGAEDAGWPFGGMALGQGVRDKPRR